MPDRPNGLVITTAEAHPFLLLSIRDEVAAADDEYLAMLRFAGLERRSLRRIVLTKQPLGAIDLDDYSGVILGGGPFNVSDPAADKSAIQHRVEGELSALINRIVAEDFPFLGCCYGVGTLGSVIGAVIDRTYGEPVGAVTVTVTDAGRDDPLFGGLPDSFDAFGGHKEAATTLPSGAVCLASSADCPVQAFRVGTNVYATQFHPELDADGIATRIDVYKDCGYFPPDTAETLKAAARQHRVDAPPLILREFVRRHAR